MSYLFSRTWSTFSGTPPTSLKPLCHQVVGLTWLWHSAESTCGWGGGCTCVFNKSKEYKIAKLLPSRVAMARICLQSPKNPDSRQCIAYAFGLKCNLKDFLLNTICPFHDSKYWHLSAKNPAYELLVAFLSVLSMGWDTAHPTKLLHRVHFCCHEHQTLVHSSELADCPPCPSGKLWGNYCQQSVLVLNRSSILSPHMTNPPTIPDATSFPFQSSYCACCPTLPPINTSGTTSFDPNTILYNVFTVVSGHSKRQPCSCLQSISLRMLWCIIQQVIKI